MTTPTGALTTSFSLDGQGNATQITDPDPAHQPTLYNYENTGWLTGVTQKVTSQSTLKTLNTYYGYDQSGNRLYTVDANGVDSNPNNVNNHVSRATYDAMNRLATEADALGNTWRYYYDGLATADAACRCEGAGDDLQLR